jgi:hypothetical protein
MSSSETVEVGGVKAKVGYVYKAKRGEQPVIVTEYQKHSHTPERPWCCVQAARIGWYSDDEFAGMVDREIGPLPVASSSCGPHAAAASEIAESIRTNMALRLTDRQTIQNTIIIEKHLPTAALRAAKPTAEQKETPMKIEPGVYATDSEEWHTAEVVHWSDTFGGHWNGGVHGDGKCAGVRWGVDGMAVERSEVIANLTHRIGDLPDARKYEPAKAEVETFEVGDRVCRMGESGIRGVFGGMMPEPDSKGHDCVVLWDGPSRWLSEVASGLTLIPRPYPSPSPSAQAAAEEILSWGDSILVPSVAAAIIDKHTRCEKRDAVVDAAKAYRAELAYSDDGSQGQQDMLWDELVATLNALAAKEAGNG